MNKLEKNPIEKRSYLEPHNDPPDAQEFLASLTDKERRLHLLAKERLASSYFMEKTNSYRAWASKKK